MHTVLRTVLTKLQQPRAHRTRAILPTTRPNPLHTSFARDILVFLRAAAVEATPKSLLSATRRTRPTPGRVKRSVHLPTHKMQ